MNAEKMKIYNYIEENGLKIEKIMDEYYNYIYKIINNMSNKLSNEDTEEIILDVFLILWQNKNKLDINKNMSSYIGGVTKNLVKLKLRKLKIEDNINDYENIFASENDLEIELIDNEKKQIIRMELEKLKDIDKQIFIEYYYKDKSIKKISTLFNMSETKIKSKLFRIRKRIKKSLKGRGYDFSG